MTSPRHQAKMNPSPELLARFRRFLIRHGHREAQRRLNMAQITTQNIPAGGHVRHSTLERLQEALDREEKADTERLKIE